MVRTLLRQVRPTANKIIITTTSHHAMTTIMMATIAACVCLFFFVAVAWRRGQKQRFNDSADPFYLVVRSTERRTMTTARRRVQLLFALRLLLFPLLGASVVSRGGGGGGGGGCIFFLGATAFSVQQQRQRHRRHRPAVPSPGFVSFGSSSSKSSSKPALTTTSTLLRSSVAAGSATTGALPAPAKSALRRRPPTSEALKSALKKPSKTLAVVLDVDINLSSNDDERGRSLLSASDLATLSMQLRKLKASALATSDVGVARELVDEQSTAKGNFPGPAPVVYVGRDDVESAVAAGVQAVVLSPQDSDDLGDGCGVDVIYRVSSIDDVAAASERGGDAFLVDAREGAAELEDVLESLPAGSFAIASVASMQPNNEELQSSKELAGKRGVVTSILVEGAVVGDGEDLEYAEFVVSGLTKKKSSTFNMSGLTGSTNGHFGGVSSRTAKTWIRQQKQRDAVEQKQ